MIVVGGLAANVFSDFGVRQDEKAFVSETVDDGIGHRLHFDRGAIE